MAMRGGMEEMDHLDPLVWKGWEKSGCAEIGTIPVLSACHAGIDQEPRVVMPFSAS
jgi:hypothetical protein